MSSIGSQRNKRLLRLTAWSAGLCLAGAAYGWGAAHIGGVPCLFRLVTGLQCPGCGVTRMCLSLFRGDLAGALRANPAVFCLLPAGAVLAGSRAVRYVKQGRTGLLPWESILVWGMILVLLVFGLLRNVF